MVDGPIPYDHMILLARAKLFHFSRPPPEDLHRARYLDSSNPGEVTSAVLANAIRGDFSHFDRLAELMKRSDDAVVWGDCAMLYAHAAPYSALHRLVERFRPELFASDDVVTQQWISEILCLSGGLSFVPDVLAIFRRNNERDRYFATPMYLSRLLEEERADIADGPPELPRTDDLPPWFDVPPVFDDDAYEQRVLARHAVVCASVAEPGRATVWEGRPLAMGETARKALARIEEGVDSEDLSIARIWLEAATGRDLSDWYANGLLMELHAAASLQSLIESQELQNFTSGCRYFFGRKIPD